MIDDKFYLRNGDQFTAAPYEFIQRMFAAQLSPDIIAELPKKLTKFDDGNQRFCYPICLNNQAVAVGREVICSIEVLEYKKYEKVTSDLDDISSVNKGKRLYSRSLDKVLHKGFPTIVGNLYISPKGRTKVCKIVIKVFADKMPAAQFKAKLYLYRKNPSSAIADRSFIY